MEQTGYGPNRRGRNRVKKIFGPMVEMTVLEGGSVGRSYARIVDYNEGGFGFLCHEAISPGSIVTFEDEKAEKHRARVTWCQKTRGGEYRLGVSFDIRPANSGDEDGEGQNEETVDYYELLQVNPKADTETIHRVFRLQAQRFHPDNKETGDAATFKLMHEAYTILTDSEKRAAYDVKLNKIQKRRWKVFEKPAEAQGVDGERKKRSAVLSMLYTKRIQNPGSPAVSISDFENVLGIPKEHLEFPLWYLRENGSISRSDNAKFQITVRGVDEVERAHELANGAATSAARPVAQTLTDRLLGTR
jgi:hypothetical protein